MFLLVLAAALCLPWFGQIIPFFTEGRLPERMVPAKMPIVYVYVLDLGVVVSRQSGISGIPLPRFDLPSLISVKVSINGFHHCATSS